MKKVNRACSFLLTSLIGLLLASLSYASTGKIAGLVTDAQTGEPLVGVNVQIEGQFLGAATDLEGQYFILNVPPGRVNLEFSFIGYKTVLVENVEVLIDRTTKIDAQLQAAIMDLGETVVVTAQRPIVETDKTSSSVHFEPDQIKMLPVESLGDVLKLSAGVIKNADGTFSMRGGGSFEINYTVNGIKSLTTNTGVPAYGTGTKSDNAWKYEINPLAVAQMEVISGGFNAEYGNAQSGVVNVVTKDGGPRFSGGLIVEYRPPGQYHWGDYLYSKNQPEWQDWGNIEAWKPYFGDSLQAMQLNYEKWVRNHSPDPDNPLGVYDYRKNPYTRYIFTFGGPLGFDAQKMTFFFSGEIKNNPTRLPTREKVQQLQNYSLSVSYKPSGTHQFKLTGLYQYFYSGMGSGSEDVRWAGLWGTYGAKRKYTLIYDSPREETVFAQSLNHRFIFSGNSYLETTLTHQSETLYALQTPTPATARDQQLHPDLKDRVLEDEGPWNASYKYRTYYTWSSIYNQASVTDYYELKSNFSYQFKNNNLFKAGIEAWLMDQDYNASSSLAVSAFIWRTGFATNYKAKTWYTAAYIQDKLEFAGMVANLGLRADAYNFGTKVPVDKYDVFYPALGSTSVGNPQWEDSKTFFSLSPRVGLSFPIAEKTAFRVQYGHFRSMPIINQALDNQTFNGWGSYGNPNLKPKLSVNYEVGLQQNLWDTHQLDIVTYYNDLKDQISPVYVRSTTGSQNKEGDFKSSYISYENNGYGNSRGIEITFQNRHSQKWRYYISYALSQTNIGYYGTYLDTREFYEALSQKYTYSASDFLAPEDRTHRFNGTLTYYVPENEGLDIWGIKPFSNTSFSLLYRLSSGLAYFYSSEYQYDFRVESNRRYPMESRTDLRIEKDLPVKGWGSFKLGVRVLNLFDNKHLTPISNTQELERWVLRGVTYMHRDYDFRKNEISRDEQIYNYFQAYKNIPRQIFISVGYTF